MAPQSDPQTVTHDSSALTPARTFPLFQRLPAELRVMIWRLSLKPRLIKIYLHCRRVTDSILELKGLARPPTRQNDRHEVFTDGRGAISKLFFVNKESRYEAQLFYKVRLPCWFVGDSNKLEPGILYFKWAHDILQITPSPGYVPEPSPVWPTAPILTDTWLRDAVLGNLVLISGYRQPPAPPHRSSHHLLGESFPQTLEQLREILFSYGRSSLCEAEGPNQHQLSEPSYKPRAESFEYTPPRSIHYFWQPSSIRRIEDDSVRATGYDAPLSIRPLPTEIHNGRTDEYEFDTWVVDYKLPGTTTLIVNGGLLIERTFIVWPRSTRIGRKALDPCEMASLETRRFNDLKECWADISLNHLSLHIRSFIDYGDVDRESYNRTL
ncbi:hypothetical protein O1611_g3369 [Lasiodiplodia mahajangana]|uniref:Uncharacterized protein n=1 Tax=Lasiodiplodia mahajangana TaxID=1108764 RepID=A0ACC2JS72_9PEZI|nr:hypothetical protein O1611_g3369 [Lasiodiplodia mahajangana]